MPNREKRVVFLEFDLVVQIAHSIDGVLCDGGGGVAGKSWGCSWAYWDERPKATTNSPNSPLGQPSDKLTIKRVLLVRI
jgi:hypothetical protein